MFKYWKLQLACVALLTLGVTSKENYKLLLVQMLFRHGERAPIELYPNDPNPVSFWKNGLGELTLLGEQQHYGLGKFFRRMYRKFKTQNPEEIKIVSSSSNRCIASALSNLASFYPPVDDCKIAEDLDWQPIPVHYIPDMIDKYMDTDSYCPRASTEEKRLKDSEEEQKFLADHREMFQHLTNYSGKYIHDRPSVITFRDTIFNEKRYNLTIPDWVEPYWNELNAINDESFYSSFNSRLLQRLRAGPLLKKILKLMLKKMNGKLPDQKFQMYSSHDANIAVLLDAYQIYPMKAVPYAAALVFELYKGNSDFFVKILYLNSTHPETGSQTPNVMKLPECEEEYCPLKQFINITKPIIPKHWESECLIADNQL